MNGELNKLILLFCGLSTMGTIIAFCAITSILTLIISYFITIIGLVLVIFGIIFYIGLMLLIAIFGIFVISILIINTISNPISKIGIYYDSKIPTSLWKQPLMSNMKIIFLNNLILSIPLYFAIMYLINPANYLNMSVAEISPVDVKHAFIATLAIVPGYLLSIRLLTHPVKKDSKIPIFGTLLKSIRKEYSLTHSFENLKERFMSFYFALTASAFFVMLMIYTLKVTPKDLSIGSLNEMYINVLTSFYAAFVPIFDSDIISNYFQITLILGGYILALFVVTAIGEIVLDKYELFPEKSSESS